MQILSVRVLHGNKTGEPVIQLEFGLFHRWLYYQQPNLKVGSYGYLGRGSESL